MSAKTGSRAEPSFARLSFLFTPYQSALKDGSPVFFSFSPSLHHHDAVTERLFNDYLREYEEYEAGQIPLSTLRVSARLQPQNATLSGQTTEAPGGRGGRHQYKGNGSTEVGRDRIPFRRKEGLISLDIIVPVDKGT